MINENIPCSNSNSILLYLSYSWLFHFWDKWHGFSQLTSHKNFNSLCLRPKSVIIQNSTSPSSRREVYKQHFHWQRELGAAGREYLCFDSAQVTCQLSIPGLLFYMKQGMSRTSISFLKIAKKDNLQRETEKGSEFLWTHLNTFLLIPFFS